MVKGDKGMAKIQAMVLGFAAMIWANPGIAGPATTLSYVCERGAQIEATYLNVNDGSFAVLIAEGRQVAFKTEETGSGARYVSLDEQAPYVWWTQNDTGELSVKLGGSDIPVISGCVEVS
jgi:membrane-bound inhibitor of C-type lysozyme